ncbi:hypothetical protein O4J56_05980 [Nocardiopsis sp. RSe5-2]|uniref:Uncharacterized protein n=1 Tax=Nocardiopsis endophytica TaxID=3018445 RepID=A0ABT4TZR8_9ACTN|nr:hypothetical protein [Nocardiopsis endophytica]MDA2810181.1 hypothetical protein [Nocardiopsis endophytica]
MDDIPYNPPPAPDPGPGGDGLPDVPPGIDSAAREWNRQHPGWVATHLPKAPSDWQWVADRNRPLDPREAVRGFHPCLYAPDLDALSSVVTQEMQAQASGKWAPTPAFAQPSGGSAA